MRTASASPQATTTESPSPASQVADEWKRSAEAAAAVHQIRNRLQSIIIEAALLKRTAAAGDPAALARIGSLAQDGAGYLELFGELIPRPELGGKAPLSDAFKRIDERLVRPNVESDSIFVHCSGEALEELLQTLLTTAIPYRGYRAARIAADSGGGRVEIIVELDVDTPFAISSTVTPWMRAQQMARDVGGSLELHWRTRPRSNFTCPRGRRATGNRAAKCAQCFRSMCNLPHERVGAAP